jgi:hypothetical protein
MARIFSRSKMIRFRPSTLPSRFARRRPTGHNALGEPRMFLLGDCGEDCDHGILEHADRVRDIAL